ncbi:methionine--tRNA ligase [Candidatus Pacearchaeota archaeon]|nr:methionine--tRNA ligase [Candidatus Pacearchaeota archaeon]
MAKKKFYITTAIDYVNAAPHIGHAYQKIVADALARWHRLLGEDVFFLTGTDEHGKKVQLSAEKAGKSPREFVDEVSEKFKEAWKLLNVRPDRFIRTTDEDHKKIVREIIEKVKKKGEVYLGTYEGLYCVDCEAYYTDKDAPDFKCPVHKKPLENLKEESYFFKLSKYKDFLLELYEKHPEFVLPNKSRNEVRNRVEEGLKDLSISRTSFDWGIPFPGDERHVVYVWFDALLNYYTATQASKKLNKFWPADVHVLGVDNTWFHTVYWPAMLKAAGLPLPKTVFNHGFLTFNGQKISKSLGNVISPKVLVEKYGADTIRYFVLRQFPFATGDSADFSERALVDRHNNELANKLGNLVSRVSTLAEKYGLEKCKITNLRIEETRKKVEKYFESFEIDRALNEIFAFVDRCNEFVQDKKPWETHDKKVLYELANAIKDAAILLSSFIPSTCEKIASIFGFSISLEDLEKELKIGKIKKSEILFRKI